MKGQEAEHIPGGQWGTDPPPPEEGQVLELAMQAGHILLESGAEIFRVEETMQRIARHFGVESEEFFVLSNGIFTTGGVHTGKAGGPYAKVQHIPVKGARLDKVVAVNQLSREIEEGRRTLEQAKKRLEEIQAMPEKALPLQVLASGLGSACFCYLFGGGVTDSLVVFFASLVMYLLILGGIKPHASKIIGNIVSGGLVTLVCIVCYRLGLGESLSCMVIGAIIPLVPGVPFTNGIRDIADGDYISGAVRLLDAILVFLCVAIGVGMVFTVYHRMLGGVLL